MLNVKLRNLLLRPLGALSLVTGLAAGGCGLEEGEEVRPLGTVQMPLSVSSASGATYRLLNARVTVFGEDTRTYNADPEDDVLSLTLPEGEHLIRLEPWWQLQEVDPTGASQVVEGATLISDNPVAVTVREFQSTDVLFQFDLSGRTIAMGTGTVNVGIEVGNACSTQDAPMWANDCGHFPSLVVPEGCRLNWRSRSYYPEPSGSVYGVFAAGNHDCVDGNWQYVGHGSNPLMSPCPDCPDRRYGWSLACVGLDEEMLCDAN